MKIRYLLLGSLAALSLAAAAQEAGDPMYMVLSMKDGGLKAVNIEEVNRLTFTSDKKMNLEMKNSGSQQIAIADIKGMVFSNDETGDVQTISDATNNLFYNPAQYCISFSGIQGRELTVHDVNGALLLRYTTAEGTQILDISSFPAGIYLVSYIGQTIKIMK